MSRMICLMMVSGLLVGAGCERQEPPPAAPPPAAPVPETPPAEPAPPPGGPGAAAQPADAAIVRTVEAACGVCIFGMEGRGCPLAVKIDGKPYFVTGASVNAHTSGLCAAAKNAAVTGQVEADRFVAASFELRP